jgi:hypothetical protein
MFNGGYVPLSLPGLYSGCRCVYDDKTFSEMIWDYYESRGGNSVTYIEAAAAYRKKCANAERGSVPSAAEHRKKRKQFPYSLF